MKLTLDIGGSKTRGFLYTGSHEEKIEILGGFGKAEDSENIEPALFASLKGLLNDKLDSITAVAVNVGGKNKRQIHQTVLALCPNARISIYRESEGILAERIMRMHNANVLLMAGTGCIVFSKSEQGNRVLGGWGKEYGDDGSGYSLGIQAVRAALKDLDSGREKVFPLTNALFGVEAPFRFQRIDEYAEARDAARSKIPKTREGVAALTKTVVACATQGCALSQKLLDKLGEELADLALTAVQASAIMRPAIVINGGVVNFRAFWENAFHERLQRLSAPVEVVYVNDGIDKALKETVEEL